MQTDKVPGRGGERKKGAKNSLNFGAPCRAIHRRL